MRLGCDIKVLFQSLKGKVSEMGGGVISMSLSNSAPGKLVEGEKDIWTFAKKKISKWLPLFYSAQYWYHPKQSRSQTFFEGGHVFLLFKYFQIWKQILRSYSCFSKKNPTFWGFSLPGILFGAKCVATRAPPALSAPLLGRVMPADWYVCMCVFT